jgi:hemolysin III
VPTHPTTAVCALARAEPSRAPIASASVTLHAVASAPEGSSLTKPRLRGVSHQFAFVAAVAFGVVLVDHAHGLRPRVAAVAFAASVAAMFGASALYHRVNWSPATRRWMRRLDHAMIYTLIAGTYTPFGLLVLHGSWRIVMLAIVWTGAAAAVVLKLAWVDGPKWLAAVIGIALGWVGVIVAPQLVHRIGASGFALLLAGGVAYTVGAIVYALRRPDPLPTLFGYHEIFHALVIAAVALQYSVVAFYVL